MLLRHCAVARASASGRIVLGLSEPRLRRFALQIAGYTSNLSIYVKETQRPARRSRLRSRTRWPSWNSWSLRWKPGELPLEASVAAYTRGSELVKYCAGQLDKVDSQVKVLEGDMLKPFAADAARRGGRMTAAAFRRLDEASAVEHGGRARRRSCRRSRHAPARLHEAMRYAVLDGGKRVRPLLVFAAGALFGRRRRSAGARGGGGRNDPRVFAGA